MKHMKIGTHNGPFHADDAFAVAALTTMGPAQIVRTRDEGILAGCYYVVDVGGVYDITTGRFDHHQRGFYDPKGLLEANLAREAVRPNGVPYSSFGLVWRCFGAAICGDQKVADKVDETLVQSVDAADCGFALQGAPKVERLRSLSISATVSLLNPTWEEQGDFDSAFTDAVLLASKILRRAIASAQGTVHAESSVKAAQEAAAGSPIVAFDRFVPWGEYTFPAGQLYTVFPSEVGTWMVQCIAPVPGSFDKRKPLPVTWGGLRDAGLDAVTGVEGGVFCHGGLFIAGHKTREGALALARLAVLA